MGRLRYALVLLLPGLVRGQTNCNQAPTAAMRTVCLQLNEWDDNARTQPVSSPMASIAAPGVAGMVSVMSVLPATVTDPAACNDIPCICNLAGGTMSGGLCTLPSGGVYGKGVRKEYRMLSDDERSRFNAAMWTMKQNGDYDRYAHIHANVNQAPSAHSGPAFLAWHREYIKRFEISLRLIDPSIALPYWDTTLEGALTDVKYSSLWSDELMGEVMSGPVDSGVFRGWTNIDGNTIQRNLGADSGRVLNANDRNLAIGKARIESVMAFTSVRSRCPYSVEWDNMEFAHGYSHVYVGGEMLVQHTAAFDPLFFLYHSFIDSLWEEWRTRRQNRNTRPTAYPPNNDQCSSTAHFSTSTMSPFAPLQNIDGCSNDYTDNLYSYDTRKPSCSLGDDCGSKYLFCDRSHGSAQCATKIRLGQPCNGYSRGEDMCYNSDCVGGVCTVSQITNPPTTQPPIVTVPTIAPVAETCFNEHECCGPWQARGECYQNAGYMRMWCQASCNICIPRLYDVTNSECADRHTSCRSWASGGECTNNPLWMTENCRASCNRCGRTREQTCFPQNQPITTMAPVTWTRRWNTRRPITRRTRRPRPWWVTQRPNWWQDSAAKNRPVLARAAPTAKVARAPTKVAARAPSRSAPKSKTAVARAPTKPASRAPSRSGAKSKTLAARGPPKASKTVARKPAAKVMDHGKRPMPQAKGFNETGPYPPHPHIYHQNKGGAKVGGTRPKQVDGTRTIQAKPKQGETGAKKMGSGWAREG